MPDILQQHQRDESDEDNQTQALGMLGSLPATMAEARGYGKPRRYPRPKDESPVGKLGIVCPFTLTLGMKNALQAGWASSAIAFRDATGFNEGDLKQGVDDLVHDGCTFIATVGALRALTEKGGEDLYVGVIGDKASVNTDNNVLVSVMVDTRPVFERALRDVRTGRFAQRPYALTLRNRGIWLFQTGRTPADAYEAGIKAGERITEGKLKVPATPTREAVDALLAGEQPEG